MTHLKTDIGSYELMAYFVIHIMPDPMRGYACSLDDCLEINNQACMWNDQGEKECRDIANTLFDWSDVSAFMYFGAKIDVGFPFNKHREEDTGGWVGPINIVMAQGPNRQSVFHDDDSAEVIERYVSRYVQTPSTNYIRMPENCTLVREEDFRKIAGDEAVKQTAEGQYDPDSPNNDDDWDPYEKYLNTCENGDVKPMLPLFQFDFVKRLGGIDDDDDSEKENIEVKLNYKLMTMPRKKDYMYDIYPKIQNRVNRAGLGFHISGPYCYGNDPKRGYSFDMNFDSRDPKKMLNLEHACVEGLPCAPPAADLYVLSKGSSIDVKPVPDNAAVVGVLPFFYLSLVFCILCGIIVHLFRVNQKLRSRLEERSGGEFAYGRNGGRDHVENGNASSTEAMGSSSTPYHAMDEDHLVISQQNGDVDCCLRDEHNDRVERQEEEMQNLLDGAE